ncbi:MAG: TraB/GumN family protein [Bacteroidota bacterium]
MPLKFLAPVLLFCCITFPLIAQEVEVEEQGERSDYALLWEITGPNLPGPSYVFGSMHVRTPSAFEFPDSLYFCLAASDAFANEIHMDSAMQRIFQIRLDQEELDPDSSYIRLTQERIVRPDTSRLKGKENGHISYQSFLRDRKISVDFSEENNFPTMLDAYLMESARRLGKKLYGLEKIDNHLYETEGFNNDWRSQFKFSWFGRSTNNLLRLYYAGVLEPMDDYIQSEPGGFNELALVARNYVMVDAMERIMPGQKLFSVVGAAHLPGKEGVLELLRQRGYNLRRVTPTFTGLRDSFLLPEVARPWPQVKAQRGLYQLAMPLGVQHVYEESVNISHLSLDMGRGITYLLLTSSMLPYDYSNFEQIFFTEDGYEVIKKTPYSKGDLSGFRYELLMPRGEPQHFLAYTFFYDQQLYYLQIGAYEKSTLTDSPDPERFVEEFDLLKKNQNKWVTVVDSVGGFQVRMPSTYIYSSSDRNDTYPFQKSMDYPWHQYRAGFEEDRASVWLQYYDLSLGQRPQQTWDRLQAGVDELENQYAIDIAVVKRDSLAGFPRWKLTGEFIDEGLFFTGEVLARGNRLYLLSAVDSKRQVWTKKFVPSFRLLPLSTESPVEEYSYFDEELKLKLPGIASEELEKLEENLSTNERYRQVIKGLDTRTGSSYEVEIQKLPYAYYVRDSLAFYNQELLGMLSESDSLLSQARVSVDGRAAILYTYTTAQEQLQQQIQLYHRGPYWIKKRMIALPAYFSSVANSEFFLSDQWNIPNDQMSFFSGSVEKITTGLRSSDTLSLRRALKSIHPQLSFREVDLPLLQEVLVDNQWAAAGLEKEGSRKLLAVLQTIGETGYELLVETFPQIPDPRLQEALLEELAFQANNEGRNALFQLLAQSKSLSDDASTKALASFSNNPALIIQYWANFSKLLANAQEPLYTWELAAQVLAQDSLSKAPILAARHLFLERGQERLRTWQQQGGKIPEAVFTVYELLPEAPGLLSQVQQILDRSSVDLASVEAVSYLLSKGKDLPKKKVRQILKDPQLRVPLIRELNRYDRLGLVEARYYSPELIARTMLLEKLTKEGLVSNVELIDEIEVLFRSEPQLAYAFTFDLDDDNSRLAVVGFFSRDGKQKPFLDEGLVNFTLYTITRRRRARKARQLLDEMKDW